MTPKKIKRQSLQPPAQSSLPDQLTATAKENLGVGLPATLDKVAFPSGKLDFPLKFPPPRNDGS